MFILDYVLVICGAGFNVTRSPQSFESEMIVKLRHNLVDSRFNIAARRKLILTVLPLSETIIRHTSEEIIVVQENAL